jgi:hypothetical protein
MNRHQLRWQPSLKPNTFRPAMKLLRLTLSLASTLTLFAPMKSNSAPFSARGIQFIPFKSLASFTKSRDTNTDELLLTSHSIRTSIAWDELIASWNTELPTNAYLKVEARAIYPDRATKWYVMGLWSGDPARHPRESVRRQKDANGNVDTDTLELVQPARQLQLRATLGGGGLEKPKLKFLGVSLLASKGEPAILPPNQNAWGKLIDVPERSQMAYENGDVLCSPTTVSMLLAHWSRELKQPNLDHDVPEVVQGVFDPKWGGTGNWVFNTAYAGSLPGMRAYTARLTDVSELEDWIAQGIPVGLSLCYNRLRGKSREPSGHLVVCVGFTENGDVIINDPGTSKNVRKTFPRANLIDAWAYSRNAAYFIYPQDTHVPRDRFGHWDSWTAKTRIQTGRRTLP